jgi:hypothetical protein
LEGRAINKNAAKPKAYRTKPPKSSEVTRRAASQASIAPRQRIPFKVVFGRAYDDKSRQEKLIKASGLDWTIARTRCHKVLREPSEWGNGIIARANVADWPDQRQ